MPRRMGETVVGPNLHRLRAQLDLDAGSLPNAVVRSRGRWTWTSNAGHITQTAKVSVQLLAFMGRGRHTNVVSTPQDMDNAVCDILVTDGHLNKRNIG